MLNHERRVLLLERVVMYQFVYRWSERLSFLRQEEVQSGMTHTVTTVPRSYVSCSTFRTCPSFSSTTSSTFYDLPSLTHAYDFYMLTVSHAYAFHMLTV